MPTTPIPAELQDALRRPNPSVMATVRSDGAPVTAPTWYLWEDDHVVLNLDEARVRLRHLRRDPRLSLTVLGGEDWYSHLTLTGRVVSIEPDPGLRDIDRISAHYTGGPYPVRDRARVTVRVEVERWYGWGALAGPSGNSSGDSSGDSSGK